MDGGRRDHTQVVQTKRAGPRQRSRGVERSAVWSPWGDIFGQRRRRQPVSRCSAAAGDGGCKASRSRPSPPPLTGGARRGAERRGGKVRRSTSQELLCAAAGSPNKSCVLAPRRSAGQLVVQDGTWEACWGGSQGNEGDSPLNGKLQMLVGWWNQILKIPLGALCCTFHVWG